MRSAARIRMIASALALAALGPACFVRQAEPAPPPYYEVAPTGWVVIEPGVYVTDWYGGPIYWMDGWYWRPYGGAWYATRDLRSGWVRPRRVPAPVARPFAEGRWPGGPRGVPAPSARTPAPPPAARAAPAPREGRQTSGRSAPPAPAPSARAAPPREAPAGRATPAPREEH